MTQKRFTCHQMIENYTTGEDIDFDFLQELIDKQSQPKDLRMHISDGNKIITYRECVDLLNNLYDENEQLKKQTKKDKLNEAIQTIDKMITTQEQYEAWSIIYEKLIGKPLSYRLKR